MRLHSLLYSKNNTKCLLHLLVKFDWIKKWTNGPTMGIDPTAVQNKMSTHKYTHTPFFAPPPPCATQVCKILVYRQERRRSRRNDRVK